MFDLRSRRVRLYWWGGRETRWQSRLGLALRLREAAQYNFGDHLSPPIVSALAAGEVSYSEDGGKLLALGSVLFAARPGDVVWGSGVLNSHNLESLRQTSEVTFRAVRGPRTRAHLLRIGLDCPPVFGDPAILLPFLFDGAPKVRGRIGIVPHFTHRLEIARRVADRGVLLIDPTRPWADVVRDITSCEVILSSSLHGLIVAEAYGIPARMLVLEKALHGDLIKFEDYFESTDRTCSFDLCGDPLDIPAHVEAAMLGERPAFAAEGLLRAFPALAPSIRTIADLERRALPGTPALGTDPGTGSTMAAGAKDAVPALAATNSRAG